MATAVQQRRGTSAQHDDGTGFTGLEGEITVDTTNDTIRVHDNSTKGGHRLAKYSELGATITAADESSDTTCFPVFTKDALGALSPKTDADGLTYNAGTKTLTTTNIVANSISGTVTNATNASSANTVVTLTTGTGDNFLLMVDADANAAQNPRVRGEVKWDVGTSNLTIDGTVTADAYTGSQTISNYVTDTAIDVTEFASYAGKKIIYTGAASTISLPNVVAADIGKSWTIVNAGTGVITVDVDASGTAQQVRHAHAGGVNTSTTDRTIAIGGVVEIICIAEDSSGITNSSSKPNYLIYGGGVI
jgi:hypothetical protein